MGTVTINYDETTKDPITLMGQVAGICWGADVKDDTKNFKRGLDCLKKNHGRVLEAVNIVATIDGYSARVIREWYTHIGCLPMRLQASTRYIYYKNFDYIVPPTIQENKTAYEIYTKMMTSIQDSLEALDDLKIPREDSANGLPLGMTTIIVDKRNLRNVLDMAGNRLCKRAYWEFQNLMNDYLNALKKISPEWSYLIDTYALPKCKKLGYCPEGNACKK